MVSRHSQHCGTESSSLFNSYTSAQLSIQRFRFNAPFTACREFGAAETLPSHQLRMRGEFASRQRFPFRCSRGRPPWVAHELAPRFPPPFFVTRGVSFLSLFSLDFCCSGTLRPLPPVPGTRLGKGRPSAHRPRGHRWQKGCLDLHLGHSTRKTRASEGWQ